MVVKSSMTFALQSLFLFEKDSGTWPKEPTCQLWYPRGGLGTVQREGCPDGTHELKLPSHLRIKSKLFFGCCSVFCITRKNLLIVHYEAY